MKKNAKFILTMLCIGLSTNIISMQQQSQWRNDIITDLKNYRPVYDLTSKEGATASWSQALAKRLSDTERIALLYECYTLPANQNANDAWRTRTYENVIAAYGEMGKDMATGITNWISSTVATTASWVASPLTRVYQYGQDVVKKVNKPLPLLDEYLKTNKDAYLNGQQNNQWYEDVLTLAKNDFHNPDVIKYLSTQQQTSPTAQVELVVERILPVIQASATKNSVLPFTKIALVSWLGGRWFQQQLPQQQQPTITRTLPNLNHYLASNSSVYMNNGVLNSSWYPNMLSAALKDFNTGYMQGLSRDAQIALITNTIMPAVRAAAQQYGITITDAEVSTWIWNKWIQ